MEIRHALAHKAPVFNSVNIIGLHSFQMLTIGNSKDDMP
jgi:hypothetical protein